MKSLFFSSRKSVFLFIAILAISTFGQLYKLSAYPVGFHVDEVRIGNAAWSILKTGKDFWGQPFPLYYDTFGDNRPAGLIYLTIPFVAVFGLTELAVRLPSALFAIASVPAIMYLAFLMFKKKTVAWASGFLLGISPWLMILGRSTSESTVVLFLFLLAFICWLQALQTNKKLLITFGSICAIASFLFYHSPRVFIPLFFCVCLLVLFVKKKLLKTALIHWIIIVCAAAALILIVPGGMGRIRQTALIYGPEVKDKITRQLQEEGPGKVREARLFHNKGVTVATFFLQNYARYFSGDFLFFDGGKPLRYNVEDFGLLYIAVAPLLLIGLFMLREEKKSGLLLLLWIMLAPVVAALTSGFQPNVQRGAFLLPALSILGALGLSVVFQWNMRIWKGAAVVVLFGALVINSAQFIHQYSSHRDGLRKNERDLDNTLLAKTISEKYGKTDQHLVIATRLVPTYEHVLFYSGFDPAAFQALGNVRGKMMWTFGKFTFYEDFCPSLYADNIGKERAVFFDFAICKPTKNFKEVAAIADGPEDIYFRIRTR